LNRAALDRVWESQRTMPIPDAALPPGLTGRIDE
jgi:hypothetical protein